MAKLPGIPDLGPISTPDGSRPVGGFDVGGFARGGAAIAEGAQRLGAGVGKLGEGVGELALDTNRWDYAKAHSDFLTKKVDLDATTAQDTNYGPDESGKSLPNRYAEKLWSLRDQSAALIPSGPMRERFLMDVAPVTAQGIEKAGAHARGQENNASIAYVTQQGDAIMDRAVHAPDDETRTQLIDSHNQLVDGLVAKGAITPVQAVAQKQAWAHQYATADLLARADTDPQGVINELQAKPGTGDQLVNRIIHVESSGNPSARSTTSSAFGAAQFLASRPGGDQTWLELLKANRPELVAGKSLDEINALRGDPNLAREMLGHLVDLNRGILGKNGVEATPGALYLSHFLGPKSAVAVLQADPGQPVADVLAKAVGPAMAGKMVAANQSVLGGRLAGSVTQWADRKMGGASPGGGGIYDFLRPDVREQILAHAQTQLQKRNVDETAAFDQRFNDTRAQAFDTGTPGPAPLQPADFVHRFGAERGAQRYRDYEADLAVAARLPTVAAQTPEQQQAFLNEIHPKEGDEGYATRLALHDKVATMVGKLRTELAQDSAAYAIKYSPAVSEAWGAFRNLLADPAVGDDDRRTAARDYATKINLEQERFGIPPAARQLVPKEYVDGFNKSITAAADSEDPQKRIGTVAQVQREAATWGDQWPAVMRQLAPTVQPTVRAIAAGADPTAMTRLLSLGKDEAPAKLLKEQSETKFGDLSKSLNEQMAPFLASLVGRQKDRDYTGYYNLAEKLGALYVRDGKSAGDAANDAFKALIGNRYDFRDTWRIPKSAGATADEVQAGTVAARRTIASGTGEAFGIKPAVDDAGLGTDNRADSLSKFARDGKFVTSNDNAGLNLVYGDKFVRREDGSPLLLTWSQLAGFGKTAPPPSPDIPVGP